MILMSQLCYSYAVLKAGRCDKEGRLSCPGSRRAGAGISARTALRDVGAGWRGVRAVEHERALQHRDVLVAHHHARLRPIQPHLQRAICHDPSILLRTNHPGVQRQLSFLAAPRPRNQTKKSASSNSTVAPSNALELQQPHKRSQGSNALAQQQQQQQQQAPGGRAG